MKTFLLTVALFAAVACATPKNKRDVSHLLKGNAQYLPPHHHYTQPQTQPQLNNQYLAPVKEALQLPSTSYGVPFNSAPAHAPSAPVTSYGTPVVNYAPAPVPHSTYGAPVVYQAPAPVYHAPAPVVHQAPVYQAPVYQAPAPVYHAPAPVYHAPAPVHQAPVYQAPAPQRIVFDAPVQSIVVSEKTQYEQVPVQHYHHGSSSSFQYSQQQQHQNVGSNGGYVY